MSGDVFALFALGCMVSMVSAGSHLTSEVERSPEEEWFGKWDSLAEKYLTDRAFRGSVAQTNRFYRILEDLNANNDDPRGPPLEVAHIPFNCDPSLGTSPSVPTSVHALRPGDVAVIGALGDSLTAGSGLGADNILECAAQNRGESWSIGGDLALEYNVTTTPNMLRNFRSGLLGPSECSSDATDVRYAWFNQAVPGAKARDMPFSAQRLVEYMVNDSRVDTEADWKMITLLIGGNDLCQYCTDTEEHSPANYVDWIRQTLDFLHANLPRTFVNLVPYNDVSPVHSVYFYVNGTDYPGEPDWAILYPRLCNITHNLFCGCVMTESGRQQVRQVQLDYYYGLNDLVNSGRYDTSDDFTVVLQPHLKDLPAVIDPITGLTDNRYFAPDCFHPNRRLHQILSYMLWNVMLTPVGKKPVEGHPDLWPNYLCPSEESPYLFTAENSMPEETSRGARTTVSLVTGMFVMIVGVTLARL